MAGREAAGRALGQRGPHGASPGPFRPGLSGCHGDRPLSGPRRGPGGGRGVGPGGGASAGEGGRALRVPGFGCGHGPPRPGSLALRCRAPQSPWWSVRGGLAARALPGSRAWGSAPSFQGRRDIPPGRTAGPGFPAHIARFPLVCQLKALSPSYFCTTSSPSTNSAAKKTDAELELGPPLPTPPGRNWLISHQGAGRLGPRWGGAADPPAQHPPHTLLSG